MAYALLPFWLKLLVDGVVRAQWRAAFAGVGGIALLKTLTWLGEGFGTRLRLTLLERVGFEFDRQIVRLTSGLPGIEHNERPDYQDRLQLLRDAQGALGNGANDLVNFLNYGVVRGVTALVILASVHPVLISLALFGLPLAWTEARAQRLIEVAELKSIPPRRLARHLHDLTLEAGAGKELRLFRLEDEVMWRQRAAWLAGERARVGAQWRVAAERSAAWIVFGFGFAASIAFVVGRALRGFASPGEVLLTVAIAAQVTTYLQMALASSSSLGQAIRDTSRLVWLRDYAAAEADRAGKKAAPSRLSRGIEFERVSFRYPASDQWALREVNLHIPAGATVALVGENGAGKSTLVKLLARFYSPTEGRIKLDGHDLADIDPQSWRERLAAGFQDFCRFEFRVAETVGLGDLPNLNDRHAVLRALKRAGGLDVLDSLPQGAETQLGRQWEGGVELSRGQWQKLALGRAMMRSSPLLLLLDEPTASLDAPTEAALFERYKTAAENTLGEGAITVLVSHRFSTVRMADLIVVIEDGRLTEQGSHDELLAKGRTYSELFAIQSRGYA